MRTAILMAALAVALVTAAAAQDEGTVLFKRQHVTGRALIELVSPPEDSLQLFKITYGLPEGVEPGRYEVSMMAYSTEPDTLWQPDSTFVIGPTLLGWVPRDTIEVVAQQFIERFWWYNPYKIGVPPWESGYAGSRFRRIE